MVTVLFLSGIIALRATSYHLLRSFGSYRSLCSLASYRFAYKLSFTSLTHKCQADSFFIRNLRNYLFSLAILMRAWKYFMASSYDMN